MSRIEVQENLLVSLERQCIIAVLTKHITEEEAETLANSFEYRDAIFSFVEAAEVGSFKPKTTLANFKRLIGYGE